MDNKLEKLLLNLNMDKEDIKGYSFLKLDKVVIKKKENILNIFLSSSGIMPFDLYEKLYVLLLSSFSNAKEIVVKLDVKNIDYTLVCEYYSFLIGLLDINDITKNQFRSFLVSIEENQFLIEVSNNAEKLKIKKYLSELKNLFINAGFIDISIKININHAKAEEMKKVIKDEAYKEVEGASKKEENPIILGEKIKSKITEIRNITFEESNVTILGEVFGIEVFESPKTDFKIITFKVTDKTDSMFAKFFTKDGDEFRRILGLISEGDICKFRGYVKNDPYAKDVVLNIRDINKEKKEKKKDTAEVKRVELHAHTKMSRMDSVLDLKAYVKRAKDYGHKAVAITDHDGVQSFTDTVYLTNDMKILYGVELDMKNDELDIVIREKDYPFFDTTFVVFDFETTGFNAGGGDSIIEIGAVKIENGEIVDTYQELIDPGRKLPKKITEITGIKDSDLKGKDTEENAVKRFKEWISDLPMVAHNAKFDVSFLEMAYKKYDLGEYTNTVIDTLQLSRVMDSGYSRHGLSQLVKRYEIDFDEEGHHRADYDAKATGLVFHQMLVKMNESGIDNVNKIDNLIEKGDIHKIGRGNHVILMVQNDTGLKNLFRLVSYANTKYFYKGPHILKSEIDKYREGLLIGSACAEGEIFDQAASKTEEELINLMKFYDYIEIQPLENYDYLVQLNVFESLKGVEENLKKIINAAKESGKMIVATGDVHHLDEEDKVYREVIINQNSPGGGRHPLNRKGINKIPSQHFRTTDEMLKCFPYLTDAEAYEYVVTNPNKIADSIEQVQIVKKGLFAPKIEGSADTVRNMVYDTARKLYGEKLPDNIEARIKQELDSIIGNNFDVIYLIAQKLVKNSNDEGYLVGSRGSVGSSFVAFLMGITEVNALPAHYVCPNCKKSLFEENGRAFGHDYTSGYDLPDRKCECGTDFKKEGQDMPFATFLGFKGDKTPDIDLNFSGEYQSKAHDYTKVLFGEKNVLRAGTVGTVAEKTAIGFALGYFEDKGLPRPRPAEVERLASGCIDVKRSNGQHPGGIIVFPDDKDMFEVTPYQYPADDPTSPWYTMHFTYHPLEDNLLKLDILGHDDPTMVRRLADLTGIDVYSIPFDDKKVMSLFSSPEVLGVSPEKIMCTKGTLGIPEFGTKFVIGMLDDTNPKTFGELLKISGLSHGTDVWLGNAQELVKDGTCPFKDVIGCRDDIMVYLMNEGLEPVDAFKIMEIVRKKGKFLTPELVDLMKKHGVKDWYIESCDKIKYMFPKAHAAAYVMMAFRVAWFKVYYPIQYYAAFLSIRANDFDIETMIKGYEAIKAKMIEITNKGYGVTNKEQSILQTLEIALEMTGRGFEFTPIDLYASDSVDFVISDDGKKLIPPFKTIDGLGETVARKIFEERENAKFISIEDLSKRGKVSQTLIEKFRVMGILEGMPESSQLTLF